MSDRTGARPSKRGSAAFWWAAVGLLLTGGGSFLWVASYALIVLGILALLQAVVVGLHLADVPGEGAPRERLGPVSKLVRGSPSNNHPPAQR